MTRQFSISSDMRVVISLPRNSTMNGGEQHAYETSISGACISELMFKKPSLFRKGKLSISFIPSESDENRVKPIKKTMEIPIDAKDTGRMKEFCKRLAADIKKPVVEL